MRKETTLESSVKNQYLAATAGIFFICELETLPNFTEFFLRFSEFAHIMLRDLDRME